MLKYFSPLYLLQKFWKDILVAILVIVAVTTWMQRNMLETNSQARNFELRTLAGKSQNLLQPSQKTLIYFFAPWCGTCKLSMSNLEAVSSDIRTVAVALDYQHQTEVADFIENIEVKVPVLLGNADIASTYKVSAYPSYYVIGANGKILDRSMGYSSLAGLLWRTR
ncbi:MAG: TlpA family protein disulfide reductase [Oceanospirillaceae bacterium]|nr:TlpA family protein disulfide reductase [Oceanospirillaceae bacterium]